VRLASQLPPDGAVGRASPSRGYRICDYLLTTVVEELAMANWIAINRGRKNPTKRPERLPYPGMKEPKAQSFSVAQLRAAQARQQAKTTQRR
jgi:hypothetical protein